MNQTVSIITESFCNYKTRNIVNALLRLTKIHFNVPNAIEKSRSFNGKFQLLS